MVLFIASCANRKISKNAIELEPVNVSSNNGKDVYRTSAPVTWDIEHTRVALEFDWKNRTAKAQEWITLHPHFYKTDTLMLDAKSMKITSVATIEKGVQKNVPFKHENDRLKISFPQTYSRYDTATIYVNYTATPYSTEAGGSAAINDDRGLYFINTDYSIPNKPAQIWTQGETESNSRWMPTIDKPNTRFTTQIELTVPDSFKTLGNGKLIKQTRNDGLRTDIWYMDKPIQAYATMFAIGNFSVIEDKWRDRDVNYYVEPAYASSARYMFRNTPDMMEFFSGITGVAYPWNKYDQVVVRDYVSGAMENTSASLFGEFMNQTKREIDDYDFEDVVSHELFHQWFGDYVTAESWSNITLNESFASYGEQLWRRHKYGDASADILANLEVEQYLQTVKKEDPPLTRFYYADKEDLFDRISYEKGGKVLYYLHGLMGDSAFYKAMNVYLTKNALHSAEVANWRLAVEEVTGQDWNWFFNQWYYKGGHPQLDIKYRYDDAAKQLSVIVTQKQDSVYILPLKTEIVQGSNVKTVDWVLKNKKEVFTYSYSDGVPVVMPDSKHWLIGEVTEDKLPKQWMVQFENSKDNILNKKFALQNVSKQLDDESSQIIFNKALNDKDADIREIALLLLQKLTQKKWQDKWTEQVKFTAENDGNNRVRAAAYDVLGAWKITSAKEDMLAVVGDSSYAVSAAALRGLNKLKADTVYSISKQLLLKQPRASQQAVVWEIIGEWGNAADTTWFVKEANYFYGRDKINFARSTNTYLQHVIDKRSFKVVLDVFVSVFRSEQIRSYRNSMVASFFETANEYRIRIADSRSNAEKSANEQRFEMLKEAANKIMQEEKDENNLKLYRPYMKKIFGV
jgi:aminopeptidase N